MSTQPPKSTAQTPQSPPQQPPEAIEQYYQVYSPEQQSQFYVYQGGYYPVETPPELQVQPSAPAKEKEKEKEKGLFSFFDDFIKSETKEPKYLPVMAFWGLGLMSTMFMPFYPWWMMLMVSFIVAIVSYKFPHLALILITIFAMAEIGYQSPALGMIFTIFALPVLGASLFDWKFGILVYYTIFLATFGVPFVVPMLTVMLYGVFYGIIIGVVSTMFLWIFVTLGNFQILGFFVGPLMQGTPTLVSGHTIPLKPVPEPFTLQEVGKALSSIVSIDTRVFSTAMPNLGLSAVPLLEIIGWCFAFYIVSILVDPDMRITMNDWLMYSTVAGGVIALSSFGGLLAIDFYNPARYDLFGIILVTLLLVGIIGVTYTTTAFGLVAREAFSQYFISKVGGTSVGSRVAEMTSLHKTTFEMVGGLADIKADIREAMIVPLMRKDISGQFGIEPPKGILLFGPPGCGKTLLMKALATELKVEMISIKCSDVMSKWYGESENRVAELFRTAKERKPCLLFLDEIDALAKRRDMYSADDVSPRLLTIILSELDGLDKATGVIVIGTTNKPELVDPALMRPGRLDKIMYVPPPDYNERIDILKVHLLGKPTAPDIDLSEIAKKTERFSGADLANLVREAATIAMRRTLETSQPSLITMDDFRYVLPRIKPSISLKMIEEYEKLKLDYERKMHVLQRAEKKIVVKWEDVGGLEDIKKALREYVQLPLTRPELMEEFKLKTGRGILLFGPPGCGKTHVMRAASNELGIPMQIVNGPELVSALAGASEAAVRDLITRARENAPSIIFFDEIDALASKESMKTPEVSRAVSQFLTEMDGLKPKDKVIIVSTTNRPQLLDPALLRPGRFDKIFYVPPPDLKARVDIFKIHLKGVPTFGRFDFMLLAHRTEGYSGADLAAIVDEAKLIAIREQYDTATGTLRTTAKKEFMQYLESLDQQQKSQTGVRMEHLLEALSKTKTSVTPETLDWCRQFMDAYGTRT